MKGVVQFIANCDNWKVVKKMNIDEKVPVLDIMDFLASISISFDNNIAKNLAYLVDYDKIDSYISTLVSGKIKKEEDFAKLLKELASVKTSKFINSLLPEMEKKDKEKLKLYIRIILTRLALKKAGLQISYEVLPIPINKGKI